MDPNTNTREQFTQKILSAPSPPASASPSWTALATQLRALLEKLLYHDAMKRNLQQTYMTPARDKNMVYFMWDFVGRTVAKLYQIDPSLSDDMPKQQKEEWTDVQGRATMAAMLILDVKSGMLDMQVQAAYPGMKGEKVEFGEEILGIAREIYKEES
ncbi:hypothetical protein ACLMJK_004403 [Lecanora helva]